MILPKSNAFIEMLMASFHFFAFANDWVRL